MGTTQTKTEKRSIVIAATLKKEWTGKYGQMYDHWVEFSNGDSGVYTSRKKDQDAFIVGKEANYTIEQVERNGFINTVIKPMEKYYENKSGRNYKADFISFAAAYTKDLIVAGKADFVDFKNIFTQIYNVMEEKLNQVS